MVARGYLIDDLEAAAIAERDGSTGGHGGCYEQRHGTRGFGPDQQGPPQKQQSDREKQRRTALRLRRHGGGRSGNPEEKSDDRPRYEDAGLPHAMQETGRERRIKASERENSERHRRRGDESQSDPRRDADARAQRQLLERSCSMLDGL